ncbi:MAG: hypothetical protein QOG75_5967 [Mycobacterium sp.]|nr:hypothetical protein [Mycobacterium sp.]
MTMKSDGVQLATLSELGATVVANRHHRIAGGRAGHDEVRAARVAAAAHRRGMTYAEIAAVTQAMRVVIDRGDFGTGDWFLAGHGHYEFRTAG